MTFYLGIFQYIYAFISLGQIFESAIARLHDQYILPFASKHIILQFGCADVQVYLSAIYENYDFYATHGLLFPLPSTFDSHVMSKTQHFTKLFHIFWLQDSSHLF